MPRLTNTFHKNVSEVLKRPAKTTLAMFAVTCVLNIFLIKLILQFNMINRKNSRTSFKLLHGYIALLLKVLRVQNSILFLINMKI